MTLAQLKQRLAARSAHFSARDYPPPTRRTFAGLDVAIENPAGSVRSGIDRDGKPWHVRMQHDYGYLRHGVGEDGEGLDVFLGPDQSAPNVHIIHQNDPSSGDYDEDKCVLGTRSADEAKRLYLSNYDDKGPRMYRSCTVIPLASFKQMLTKGQPGGVHWKRKMGRDHETTAMFAVGNSTFTAFSALNDATRASVESFMREAAIFATDSLGFDTGEPGHWLNFKSDEDADDVWKTIGAKPGADGKRHGGTHVLVKESTGEIEKGPKQFIHKKVDELPQANSAKDVGNFFRSAKNAGTDSFVDAMWKKVQSKEPISRMAPLESKLRDAQKAGSLKSRDDVANIVASHFSKNQQPAQSNATKPLHTMQALRERLERGVVGQKPGMVGLQKNPGQPVPVDKEVAAFAPLGNVTLPTHEGKLDPHLEDAYRRAAGKQGFELGAFKVNPETGLASADVSKIGSAKSPAVTREPFKPLPPEQRKYATPEDRAANRETYEQKKTYASSIQGKKIRSQAAYAEKNGDRVPYDLKTLMDAGVNEAVAKKVAQPQSATAASAESHPLYDRATGATIPTEDQVKAKEREQAAQAQPAGQAAPAATMPAAAAPTGAMPAQPTSPMPQQPPAQPATGAMPEFPHQVTAGDYLNAYKQHREANGLPVIASHAVNEHEKSVAEALKAGHNVPPDVPKNLRPDDPRQKAFIEAANKSSATESRARAEHEQAVKEAIAKGEIQGHSSYPNLGTSAAPTPTPSPVASLKQKIAEKKAASPVTSVKQQIAAKRENDPAIGKKIRARVNELAAGGMAYSDAILQAHRELLGTGQSAPVDAIKQQMSGKREFPAINKWNSKQIHDRIEYLQNHGSLKPEQNRELAELRDQYAKVGQQTMRPVPTTGKEQPIGKLPEALQVRQSEPPPKSEPKGISHAPIIAPSDEPTGGMKNPAAAGEWTEVDPRTGRHTPEGMERAQAALKAGQEAREQVSVDGAIDLAKKQFHGKPTAEQVEQVARDRYFNDDMARKAFLNHKEFGAAVRKKFEQGGVSVASTPIEKLKEKMGEVQNPTEASATARHSAEELSNAAVKVSVNTSGSGHNTEKNHLAASEAHKNAAMAHSKAAKKSKDAEEPHFAKHHESRAKFHKSHADFHKQWANESPEENEGASPFVQGQVEAGKPAPTPSEPTKNAPFPHADINEAIANKKKSAELRLPPPGEKPEDSATYKWQERHGEQFRKQAERNGLYKIDMPVDLLTTTNPEYPNRKARQKSIGGSKDPGFVSIDKDAKGNVYTVDDGNHRVAYAKAHGQKTVPMYVMPQGDTPEDRQQQLESLKQHIAAKRTVPTSPHSTIVAPKEVESLDESKFIPAKQVNEALRSNYFNPEGNQTASSRQKPAGEYPYKPGDWKIDDHFGSYGRQIEKLVELDPNKLHLSEEDYTKSNAEGRGDDAQQYAKWMKEGKTPPPVDVVETDSGNLKVSDGHRRVAAAKMAGKPILAWVSPRMDIGRKDSNGNPIYMGMTYEGMKHGPAKAQEMSNQRQRDLMSRVQADRDKQEQSAKPPELAKPTTPVEQLKLHMQESQARQRAQRQRMVEDFGEKIGGARKDVAVPLGPRAKGEKGEVDERPAWQKRYGVHQDAKSGKYFVTRGDDAGGARRMLDRIYGRGVDYDTKEEAERAIPLMEVARNHAIYQEPQAKRDPAHEEAMAKHHEESQRLADEWLEGVTKDVANLKEKNSELLTRAFVTDRFKAGVAKGEMTQAQYDDAVKAGKILNDADYGKAAAVRDQIKQAQEREIPRPAEPPPASASKPTYGIYRKVSDRKRPLVKGGFESEDAAKKYLVQHPAEVIEHKFPFPDEVEHLKNVERTGQEHRAGNVKPKDFHEAFGFRGGEFGNWNSGREGQEALNHAYDGLHDLADAIGVPPKAVSLDGKLAIAFGARGHGGKDSAAAHYETGKEVMNLTKLHGAGHLAHEWFHALDHYIGKQAGKTGRSEKPGDYFASHGFPAKHSARQEVVDAFKNVIDTLTAKTIDKPIEPKFETQRLDHSRGRLEDSLKELDRRLESEARYNKRFKKFAPDQQAKWDDLKAKLLASQVGAMVNVPGKGEYTSRTSYANIEAMNDLYKQATGRSFTAGGQESQAAQIFWQLHNLKEAEKRVEAAHEGQKETKKAPTEYFNEARKIDSYRASDYYATPHELAARAFAAYVHDKIAGGGNKSQYLVHGTKNHALNASLGKPFPEGEERQRIHEAFERLFKAMQTKERKDDKGGTHVQMFSADQRPRMTIVELKRMLRNGSHVHHAMS